MPYKNIENCMKNILYTLLDLLTLKRGIRRFISGFSLRIPVRFFKYFENDYELNNINFINNYVKKDAVIIDIGAHIGLLSVILAQKAGPKGKVYAFEPTPSTFAVLEETVRINQQQQVVTPVNAAVAGENGKAVFYVTDIAAHNSNSLADNKRNYGNERGVEVDLVSVDSFKASQRLAKIDFIKIDAEGAEYAVLKGATSVLTADRPHILLALHPFAISNFGDHLSDIWDFVKKMNYQVFYMSKEIEKDFFISQPDLFDVFLLPR